MNGYCVRLKFLGTNEWVLQYVRYVKIKLLGTMGIA